MNKIDKIIANKTKEFECLQDMVSVGLLRLLITMVLPVDILRILQIF